MSEIDWRGILKAYIGHVIEWEGTDFLGMTKRVGGLTVEETALLNELAEEWLRENPL